MKKKMLGILVCTLLIAATALPVAGTINVEKSKPVEKNILKENEERGDLTPRPFHPLAFPELFYKIFNYDWNYWSNPPHMYTIPTGGVGIGTDNPQGLLQVGEETFIVDVNGNVGIHITNLNPDHALTVCGNTFICCNDSSLLFGDDCFTPNWGEWGIEYWNGGLNFWKPFGSSNWGNNKLFLKDDGNVGIGTDNPLAALHVMSSVGQMELSTTGLPTSRWHIHGTDNAFAISDADQGGLYRLWIRNDNGNVGIGTTSPENALHVNGAINLDPITVPTNPSTGFVLYCDSSDGRLKAKSSTGTVTVLANP